MFYGKQALFLLRSQIRPHADIFLCPASKTLWRGSFQDLKRWFKRQKIIEGAAFIQKSLIHFSAVNFANNLQFVCGPVIDVAGGEMVFETDGLHLQKPRVRSMVIGQRVFELLRIMEPVPVVGMLILINLAC